MKTQANKTLKFNKKNIVELNDTTLKNINGGTETSVAIQSHMSPVATSWLCNGNNAAINKIN